MIQIKEKAMRKNILHKLIGHIPFYAYTDSDGIHHHRCLLGGEFLHNGPLHRPWKDKN